MSLDELHAKLEHLLAKSKGEVETVRYLRSSKTTERDISIDVGLLSEGEKRHLAELEQGLMDLAQKVTEETRTKVVLKDDSDPA